jgi:hypothetical protein
LYVICILEGIVPEPDETTRPDEAPEKGIADTNSEIEGPGSKSGGSEGDEDSQNQESPFTKLIQMREGEPTNKEVQQLIHEAVRQVVSESEIAGDYRLLIIFDPYSLTRLDADKIYRALQDVDEAKPILLVLNSSGGSIPAAYFIGKLCREYSPDRVAVAVPRRAKSGATLVCCGADVIHMGSLSELGPIDPQFEGVPALALKYSIEHLAELTGRHPEASSMFAEYLSQALEIDQLGYYERVAESAVQYARRLLRHRCVEVESDDGLIAHRLVYAYKDHGFVIDSTEAQEIFTGDVVKVNTPEYELANKLYGTLAFAENICREFLDKRMYFTGGPSSGCSFISARTR